jgi:uncharacterized membrane protein YsdA (DUF1294 family)
MDILFYFFLILNGIVFALTAYDKYLAKANKHRIPELTLLSFVFVGGAIGSGFAMLIFRHKTSKTSYLWKYWGIVFLHILIAFLWICFRPFQ